MKDHFSYFNHKNKPVQDIEKMKIGVLTFGYENFNPEIPYTVNIGDNVQSIAVRKLLKKIGVPKESILSINRDTLPQYSGPNAALIMNGVFYEHCFPLPNNIKPIFIGFCARENVIIKNKDYFAQNSPIGCRDKSTAESFKKLGIDAYVTGCLSMTIPNREESNNASKIVVVLGGRMEDSETYFPAEIFSHMPTEYFSQIKFIYQRMPMSEYPVSPSSCMKIENYALKLLKYYADNAKLIITPLHHVTAPCIGLGIPVILCRHEMKFSFDYLADILPFYTPNKFKEINWNPQPINIESTRSKLEHLTAAHVNSALSS